MKHKNPTLGQVSNRDAVCPSYFAMDMSKMPRNWLSEVWYMQFTMLISQIRKYTMLPRVATTTTAHAVTPL